MKFEVYPAKDGWRWRAVAPENGEIMADSGQGYNEIGDALHGLDRISCAINDPDSRVQITYGDDTSVEVGLRTAQVIAKGSSDSARTVDLSDLSDMDAEPWPPEALLSAQNRPQGVRCCEHDKGQHGTDGICDVCLNCFGDVWGPTLGYGSPRRVPRVQREEERT